MSKASAIAIRVSLLQVPVDSRRWIVRMSTSANWPMLLGEEICSPELFDNTSKTRIFHALVFHRWHLISTNFDYHDIAPTQTLQLMEAAMP